MLRYRIPVLIVSFVIVWGAVSLIAISSRAATVLLPPRMFYAVFVFIPLLATFATSAFVAHKLPSRAGFFLAVLGSAIVGFLSFAAQMRAVVAYALTSDPHTEGVLSNFVVTAHSTLGVPLALLLAAGFLPAAIARRSSGSRTRT